MISFLPVAHAQHVYQIRADSVRIYNVCDTAELIIENRTRGVAGYLYNKGNGRTEFRKLEMKQIGGTQLAILGQDTIDLAQMSGVGGIDTIYRVGDSIRYVKKGMVKGIFAPVSTTLANVLANGNQASNSITLGAVGDTMPNQLMFKRRINNQEYIGSIGYGKDMTSMIFAAGSDNLAQQKMFYIPFGGTGPMYSGDNGTTKYKIWHEGNDGTGSGLDADKLAGLSPSINATVSTIAQRNITGQLFATFFNTSAPTETMTPTRIFGSNDGYIRPLDAASVRSFIGSPAGGETLESVMGRGSGASRTIQFMGPATPYTNGLLWSYNSDTWRIFVETPQDTPAGNMIFEARDNNEEGWIFRHARISPMDTLDVLSIGRDRFKYAGFPILHTGNHAAGSQFTSTFTGAQVPASFSTNASGHVTVLTTRTLTPADIGAAPASGSANYILNGTSAQTGNFNVSGIGTLGSAQTQLILSNASDKGLILIGGATAGESGRGGQITLFGGSHSTNQGQITFHAGTGMDGTLQPEVMRIMPNGRVGIGTTGPTEKLHVTGNANITGQTSTASGSRIIGDAGGLLAYSWLGFYDNANRRMGYIGKGSNSSLNMQIYSDTANVMIMPKGGNALTVANTTMTYDGGELALTNPTSNTMVYSARASSVAPPSFSTRSPGTKIVLYPNLSASSVDYAIGVESGTVWSSVANSTAGYKWYAGTTSVASLSGTGNLFLTGSATATAYFQSSLRSLKKDITPFNKSALDVLGKAEVRSFRFKADSTNHLNIGFIADEVPEEMSSPGKQGVDQASTIGLLVKAIQELKAEKEALEARLKAVEEKLMSK